MSTVGVTREEIRDYVHQYNLQPHGTRTAWLQQQPFSRATFYRWNQLVFEGDLDRNLFPRDHGQMNTTPSQRSAFEQARAKEQAEHEDELKALRERVRQLEGTNEALGKAIGFLHALNEQEPATSTTDERKNSSPRKTN
jgi:beta-phosphoglucomutase-like phosphatase (HAD superfamily)